MLIDLLAYGGITIKVQIYIEKHIKNTLLIDFIENEDFIKVCKIIDDNFIAEESMTDKYRTMFLITEYEEIEESIREGVLYNIDIDFFEDLSFSKEPVVENENAVVSSLVAYRGVYTKKSKKKYFNSENISFKSILAEGDRLIPDSFVFKEIDEWENSVLKVIVKNVGQGNWNEIYADDRCTIIYDIGASINYPITKMKDLINSGRTAFDDNPCLILSHWDVDHYLGVFHLSSDLVQKFKYIILPRRLPNKTSKRAFEFLKSNCGRIFTIPECSFRAVPKKISLETIFKGKNIMFLRGEKSSDRNKSGLAIAVYNSESCAILSADHHYSQLMDIINNLNTNLRLNIVTPHHGGNAGNINKLSGIVTNLGLAVTSTGENNYGHPFSVTEKELKNLGFKWERTDILEEDRTIIL